MAIREESWLARWSRRKLAGRACKEHAEEPKTAAQDFCSHPSIVEPSRELSDGTSADTATLAEIEADLAALNAQSDYRPFLREGVRPEVRSAALRRLWSSEPIFSQSRRATGLRGRLYRPGSCSVRTGCHGLQSWLWVGRTTAGPRSREQRSGARGPGGR